MSASGWAFKKHRKMGIEARKAGIPITACPTDLSKTQQAFWRIGWEEALQEKPMLVNQFTVEELRHILSYCRSGKSNGCVMCGNIIDKIVVNLATGGGA